MSVHANKIDDTAAQWAVRLSARSLLPEERQQLDAWLAEDVRHRGALVRSRAAWTGLDRFASLAAGRQSIVPNAPTFNRRWAIAAGLSTLTLGGLASWVALRASGTSYTTGVGEQRRVPLADGSKMVLNTSTEVVVSFEATRREVHLLRGEAMFEVAKDPSRPFLVRTDRLLVRAVGTAFVVRVDDARVDVTVAEGVVEVSSEQRALAAETAQRVSANERAVALPSRSVVVAPIPHEDVERRLAWRNGMVAFNGEPLSEAVAEVNRHSARNIVIDDPQLASRPIVGIFRASDTEEFARTAAAALGAQVVIEGAVIHVQLKSAL